MNKFVVFSDMHFHEWTYGSTVCSEHSDSKLIGLNDRLIEQWEVSQQILKFCQTNQVKYVFFCGDLFHKFGLITAPVMEIAVRMAKAFKDSGIELFCLVGNHDMYSKDGSRHALHCINAYAKIISHPQYIELYEGFPLAFCPYTEDKQVLTEFLNKTPHGSFVFMHQGVANVPMASGYVVNEILDASMVPSTVSLAFTGHYHAHRIVSNNLIVVGSPIHQSFADSGETSGFIYVDLEQGSVERIKTKARQFKTINKQSDIDTINPGDFIRVIGDLDINNMTIKPSTIEKIVPPKDIKIISNQDMSIRKLIEITGKANDKDTTTIIDIMENRHPFLKD